MFHRHQPIQKTIIRCLWFILCLVLFPWPARAEEQLPAKAYVSGVKGHPQTFSLSCESRSAVDWAAYFGVEISEKKFLNHLPRSDNPNQGFVGNPGDPLGNIPPQSYGVYAGPVAALLSQYGLPSQAVYDYDWEQLRAEITADRPVIVWVIGQMWNGTPVKYTASDGEQTTVASYEHTMIVVGYTPKFVMAIDAATGREGTYSLSTFQTSWKVLGRMAVIFDTAKETVSPTDDVDTTEPLPQIPGVIQYPTLGAPTQLPDATMVLPLETQNPAIIPPAETPDPTMSMPTQTPEPTSITRDQAGSEETQSIYIVRRGDYLTGIARRFGVNWRNLARVNHLTAPYILYTGQKLHIP